LPRPVSSKHKNNLMFPKTIAPVLVLALLLAWARLACALPAELVLAVAAGQSDEQVAAVGKLVASGDAGVEVFFRALLDGNVRMGPTVRLSLT
jgi:urea transport system permease protein